MKLLDQLKQTVSQCLARFEGHAGDGPILVAVSGGRDSTALLWLLAQLKAEDRLVSDLHVGHVDHAIHERSAEAAERVQRLCDELGLPCTVERLSAVAAAEEALRDARYEVLSTLASTKGSRLMLTAHHADDNIETVLFRMLRGTGPRGLAGIPEFRRLSDALVVVRPLLKVRAETLGRMMETVGLSWFEDPTNEDLRYSRNQLRHELVPELKQTLGTSLDMSLIALSRTAGAVTDLVNAQALRLASEDARFVTPWRCEFAIRDWSPQNESFFAEALCLVHEQFEPGARRPPWSFLERVIELIGMDDGQRVAGQSSLLVERTRAGLLLVDTDAAGTPPEGTVPIELAEEGSEGPEAEFGTTEWRLLARRLSEPPLSPSPTELGKRRALLDPTRTELPWALRARRSGDRFWPLGAKAPVDLRRFLQSRHVPRFDRDRLPMLVDAADQVLWVPGVEIAEPCRIELHTTACVEVELRISGENVEGTPY